MCRDGMLLVPEKLKWRTPFKEHDAAEVAVKHTRLCFTHLELDKIDSHCREFGPYSLEFPYDAIRKIGASPVAYVQKDEDIHSPSRKMMNTIFRFNAVWDQLEHLANLKTNNPTSPPLEIVLSKPGEYTKNMHLTSSGHDEYKGLMEFLLSNHGLSLSDITHNLFALMSLWVPTGYKLKDLSNFQQREWRLTEPLAIIGNQTLVKPTPTQIKRLCSISAFFSERPLYASPHDKTRAEDSRFLKYVEGQHILTLANRLIVPDHNRAEAERILRDRGLCVPVTGMSDV